MKMSNEVNELFGALSKAQGALTGLFKNKKAHGYNYADLANCIETAKEPLERNGLSVVQLFSDNGEQTTLITVLAHSSGQFISSEFTMEKAILQGGAGKNPAQQMGASITYMRRYAYAAALGLAQEDDDAAKCRKEPQKQQKVAPRQQIQQTPPTRQQQVDNEPITGAQIKCLQTYYSNNKIEKPQRLERLSSFLGRPIGSMNELTKDEAGRMIEIINGN